MNETTRKSRLGLDIKRNKVLMICRAAGYAALAVIFLLHPKWYYHVTSAGIYFAKKRMAMYGFAALFMIFLPCFKMKQIPRKTHFILNIPLIAVSLLGAFATGEYIMQFQFWTTAANLIALNLVILFAMFVLFFVITNRVKHSLFIVFCIVTFFSIVNYFVYEFRGEPINAADFYVLGTALNVAGAYSFDINWYMFNGLFVMFSYGCFLLFLPEDVPPYRGVKRAIMAIPSLGFVVFTGWFFMYSDVPKDWGIKVKVFRPYESYHTNGSALNFFRGFYYLSIDKPEGYTADAAKELMDSSGFTSDDADKKSSQEQPNVIVIMNESLTDFTKYDKIQLSDDPLEYIHSLEGEDNAVVGQMDVDVFGGRTANTEYEYLTGNSIAFMPQNAVPYATYCRKPQPSIARNMIDIGYSGCDAFHPYIGNGYSRPRAYTSLGFNNFISIETIEDQLTDADYLRNKVSDSSDMKFIEKYYEQAKSESDAPFFMFNVTIQNHGGYTKDYDNFDQDIEVSGALSDDEDFKRFINLCDYSDEAFEELCEYFEKVDEPTIIVMFGDHRPNLHNNFYKRLYGVRPSKLGEEEMFDHYSTPLVIWGNYDFNKDGAYDQEFSEISINYLSAAVTELAGLPQTGYQKFLNSMREEIPVFTLHGYKDTNGNIYKVEDESSPLYELVNEYHIFEYNYQFDTKNRNDAFFSLVKENGSLQQAQDSG